MRQDLLKPPKGAKRLPKRVGRGDGSGHGSYSGRGMKGQNSRSGGGVRPGFEGGQNPLAKALPMMRGFTNIFRKEFSVVNLNQLSELTPNTEITPQTLVDAGLVKNLKRPIKVLARGELKSPITVAAQGFSRAASAKIEAAGGSMRVIE